MNIENVVKFVLRSDSSDTGNTGDSSDDCANPLAESGRLFRTSPKLDMEEFNHYASEHQGSAHIVVPGKILDFPQTCATLQDSATWKDTANRRQFSSASYAELLQYLKVNIVFKEELSIVDEEGRALALKTSTSGTRTTCCARATD